VLLNKKQMLLILAGLSLFLVVLLVATLFSGEVTVPFNTFVKLVGFNNINIDQSHLVLAESILLELRLPRALSAILVGALLAISGACMQTLFRNPLADPALIGVSSGAGLGMALALIVLPVSVGVQTGNFILLISAFAGGLLVSFLVYGLSKRYWGSSIASMLLLGVGINAIVIALIGLIKIISDDSSLRSLVFWMLGNVSASSWAELRWLFPLFLLCFGGIMMQATKLNVLMLGEAEAGHLGLDVTRLKTLLFLWVAIAVAISVAIAGMVAFVGLLVPHLVRLFLVSDHRYLLPASALSGAILLLASDTLARTLFLPQEIPLGVVTALVGGPVFIVLLLRKQWHLAL